MGTWSSPESAWARRMERETPPLGKYTFLSQGCPDQYDDHNFARDDPKGRTLCRSTVQACLTVPDSLICLR